MMKRTGCFAFTVTVAALLALPNAATGGPATSPPANGRGASQDTPRRAASEQNRAAGADDASQDRGDRSEAAARRQVAQLSKLNAVVIRKLDLTADQESAVDRLFRAYIASLRGGSRPFGVSPSDAVDMAELRERLRAAREAGDERSMQRLRQEFRDKMNSRRNAVALSLDDFLAKVSAYLSSDQREMFQRLVQAVGVRGGRERSADGGLRRFWRAVTSPGVALSNEQRRVSTAIMRDGIADLSEAYKNGEDIAAISTRIQGAVLQQLTDAQRTRVEVLLGLRRPATPDESPAAPTETSEEMPKGQADTDGQTSPEKTVAEEPKPASDATQASEPKPEAESESKPKNSPEIRPDPQKTPEPAPKDETREPEPAESEPKAEPKSESESETKPDAKEKNGSDQASDPIEYFDEDDEEDG